MNPMLLKIPKSFESERLKIRIYQEGDGETFYNNVSQNKEHLKLVMPKFVLNVSSIEEGESLVQRTIADFYLRKRFIFGVWEKESNNFVAEIYIEPHNWDIPLAEIGYYVLKNKEGKGFVTEAVKASLKFSFVYLKLNKLELYCDTDNVRSYKVAEKCNFIKEGVLRNSSIRNDGVITDKACYGMTKNDFEKRI